MIRAIVFDFDGVVVRNSEFGKDKGWGSLFPEAIREKVNSAKKKFSGGRGSRLDIIRELAPAMNIPLEDVDSWVAKKAQEFGDFTRDFTLNDGVIPEDKVALQVLAEKYPLYLNSATPESVLIDVARTLGINQFFRGIYGQRNERSKIENMERASADSMASSTEILFVGDQDTDLKVAENFGCPFVGVMNDWNKWGLGDRAFPLVSGVKDLPDYLSSL